MAKRVFEIAKEMGIASKSIVAKCHAEGIPESLVKNHMSTISVGLEATIREWFSSDESNSSAVETTEKVDIEKVRVAPKPAKAKAKPKAASKASPKAKTAAKPRAKKAAKD